MLKFGSQINKLKLLIIHRNNKYFGLKNSYICRMVVLVEQSLSWGDQPSSEESLMDEMWPLKCDYQGISPEWQPAKEADNFNMKTWTLIKILSI